MTEKKYPKVGIGVMIINDNDEFLLGLRRSSHGAGEWCFPGGHLEWGETITACAKREVKEETGLDIDEVELISVGDEMRYLDTEGKHYVGIGFIGIYQGGEPQLLEPDRYSEWRWFSRSELPKNIFEGSDIMIKNFFEWKLYSKN
jgi:8-oxo-dGTP diphosphatase